MLLYGLRPIFIFCQEFRVLEQDIEQSLLREEKELDTASNSDHPQSQDGQAQRAADELKAKHMVSSPRLNSVILGSKTDKMDLIDGVRAATEEVRRD